MFRLCDDPSKVEAVTTPGYDPSLRELEDLEECFQEGLLRCDAVDENLPNCELVSACDGNDDWAACTRPSGNLARGPDSAIYFKRTAPAFQRRYGARTAEIGSTLAGKFGKYIHCNEDRGASRRVSRRYVRRRDASLGGDVGFVGRRAASPSQATAPSGTTPARTPTTSRTRAATTEPSPSTFAVRQIPQTGRGDAAAVMWIFRGHKSRLRCGDEPRAVGTSYGSRKISRPPPTPSCRFVKTLRRKSARSKLY